MKQGITSTLQSLPRNMCNGFPQGDKQDKDSPVMSGPPKIRSILKRRSSVRPPSPLPVVLLSGCLAGHVDLPLARTLLTDDAAVAAIAL